MSCHRALLLSPSRNNRAVVKDLGSPYQPEAVMRSPCEYVIAGSMTKVRTDLIKQKFDLSGIYSGREVST